MEVWEEGEAKGGGATKTKSAGSRQVPSHSSSPSTSPKLNFHPSQLVEAGRKSRAEGQTWGMAGDEVSKKGRHKSSSGYLYDG